MNDGDIAKMRFFDWLAFASLFGCVVFWVAFLADMVRMTIN